MTNQFLANRNTANTFIYNNKYVKRVFKNISGGALTLVGGEVIGAITSGGDAGKYYLTTHNATNGSQIPFGINVNPTSELANGEEVTLLICVSGDVAVNGVVLPAGTTLTSLIDAVSGDGTAIKSLQDRLMSDTMGIYLQTTTETTDYDNQ